MKWLERCLWMGCFLALPWSWAAPDPTAKEVVATADRQLRGKSQYAELRMKIVRPEWSREMAMKWWSLGEDYFLILITAPVRDQGTAFLKRGKEVWQWVPAIQRMIKIPPSLMGQSWMGSDFTNDDLVKEVSLIRDYSHRFLADTVLNERRVYRVEMIPRPEAPIVWDKVILWVAHEGWVQQRSEFFDESGHRVYCLYMDEFQKVGSRWVPMLLQMIPDNKPQSRTEIRYTIIQYDLPLSESFFSLHRLRNLSQGVLEKEMITSGLSIDSQQGW